MTINYPYVAVKELKLTKGYYALIDDEDYPLLSQFSWHAHTPRRGLVYARRNVVRDGRKRTELLHRIILGVAEPKNHVDHCDGDGLNNTRENLRIATYTQNAANARKRKDGVTSRFRGVSRYLTAHRKVVRWAAQISGEAVHRIGSFRYELAAAAAYNASAHRRYGEFARLNDLTS